MIALAPVALDASARSYLAPKRGGRTDLVKVQVDRFGALKRRGKAALSAIFVGVGLAAAAPAAAAPLKPLIRGLISMGPIGFHRNDDGVPTNSLDSISAMPGVMSGIVVNVSWAQLQPTPGVLDTTAIDSALADVRAYNAKFPATPLAVSLRIWAGPNSPPWVKSLGGPPVAIQRIYPRQPLQTITIGRFWSQQYAAKWIALQTALGQKYDADPLIREISDTSCSSYTDELFVIAADPVSLANMQQAGFSDAAFRACLERSPTDYAAWRTTRLQVAINPFRQTDSGSPVLAPQLAQEIVQDMRRRYGQRIIVSNHALRSPPFPWLSSINDILVSLGPPLEFQTDAPKDPKGFDWDGSIRLGAQLGAGAVEVWATKEVDGFETVPEDDLKRWSALLSKGQGAN